MKTLETNSVDSIVTDPPYGLSFMGKHWDIDVPKVEIWKEAIRVLKPGGHIISFGGTRTYHRMAVAIEDAGFEIRDMVSWIYGSGFPKSLNIGKAVDKLQGNEREKQTVKGKVFTGSNNNIDGESGEYEITKGNSPWEGCGTALKPSHEDCVLARKPLDYDWYFDTMVRELLITLCQSPLLAPTAKKLFQLNPNAQGEVVGIVQWLAAKNTNTQDALFALMGTLQSDGKTDSMTWNIELLCLNTLVDLYNHWSTFTTEMKTGLITDLKTLTYYLAQTTQNTTTEVETKASGNDVNVSLAATVLNALQSKLLITQELSATESAIDRAGDNGLRPSADVSVLARKPLSEKTVAENVLKWGTGGLNIDASRVGTEVTTTVINGDSGGEKYGRDERTGSWKNPPGRFPANIIHDGSPEVLSLFPKQKSPATYQRSTAAKDSNIDWNPKEAGTEQIGYGDSGSAARFFYCAKVSKSERNRGCEGLEDKITQGMRANAGPAFVGNDRKRTTLRNHHPTVKPIALMEYLIKLVTPKGGTVLDPFMGSGSTGMAAKRLGHSFIGIELDPEYYEIAKRRIAQPEK